MGNIYNVLVGSVYWLGSPNENNTNNEWNVNGNNSNFNNNNVNNDNNYGLRPAFRKTKYYITKVYSEKLWKTSIFHIVKDEIWL